MNLKEKIEEVLAISGSYRRVFETKDGERVLRHICKMCGLYNPQITADPNMALVRQGQQHIFLSICRAVNREPQDIIAEIERAEDEADK